MSSTNQHDDEKRLAALGYKQELSRTWSSFSNFAISFSIISILAGCFTTFAQAWNNGGPVAISIGWPLISFFILIIGFCMSELASAYPTSGGIYWWASRLGGPKAGFYTGWLNLIGLVSVTASVGYGAASFLNILLGGLFDGYGTSFMGGDYIKQQFALFIIIMILVTLINIFSSHLLALVNNISVWWHVFGAVVVIGILLIVPEKHQSLNWMFTEQINNSGFSNYWFYVLPLGFLLTQYTITGFDASAHLSEETKGAHMSAAYASSLDITFEVRGGLLMRQVHHWSALLFVAAAGLHMLRVFFTGAFRKPRELNWVVGFVLFVLGMAGGFTGYSLPDDLLSGNGLRIIDGMIKGIPFIGTSVSALLFGGEFPGTSIVGKIGRASCRERV